MRRRFHRFLFRHRAQLRQIGSFMPNKQTCSLKCIYVDCKISFQYGYNTHTHTYTYSVSVKASQVFSSKTSLRLQRWLHGSSAERKRMKEPELFAFV